MPPGYSVKSDDRSQNRSVSDEPVTNGAMRSTLVFFSMVVLTSFAACAGANADTDILSGTVRLDPESGEPAGGTFVRIVDSNKSRRCFVTACDGTFSVRPEDFPRLQMPLVAIEIERVVDPRAVGFTSPSLAIARMRGAIRDVRSCNGCHAGGVSFFRSRDEVPSELRAATAACTTESLPIVCPEDLATPSDELEIIRDIGTYTRLVHAVMERRCGGSDCHASEARALRITSDRDASFRSVIAHAPQELMDKARGARNHEGGAVVVNGDLADQCVSDWLGIPRAESSVQVTHAAACRMAAE
jgi:hypothetical protein